MKTKNSGVGFCVPRVKNNSRTTSDREISVTLLDRFREAVLRLIMISAVAKSPSRRRSKQPVTTVRCQKNYNPADAYHNEAVADCIEFIRTNKAIDLDHGR
ncbi:hypothetical protein AALP_AA8G497900 [Arabis alpina]|uniref:Uncharacterized protein n=1 Tax=Arabis alpina TaxID=50452 RepID=A0A087GEJ6_ARAAL|nr:hypothetical protein AALP_AA8G497900 [Arabis alpina]